MKEFKVGHPEGSWFTMDPMPTLNLHFPEKNKRWSVTVNKDTILIGRSAAADVRIPIASVSKEHAVITRQGGRYVFRDLGSRNGVQLNGFRATHGTVADGDELQLGGVTITFWREKPLEAPKTPKPEKPGGARPGSSRGALDESWDLRPNAAEAETLLLMPLSHGPSGERTGPPARAAAAERRPPLERESSGPQEDEPAGADRPSDPVEATREGGPVRETVRPHFDADRHRGVRRALAHHLSLPGLILLVTVSVAGGLFLGFIDSWLGTPGDESALTGEGAVASTEGQASQLEELDPVSREDSESVRRLIFRLCLDFLGRPPLRDELRELLGLSPEDLWVRVDSRRERLGLPPPTSKVSETFPRFLGRAARPGELEKLIDMARGDQRYLVFHLTTSRIYSSVSHRRNRSSEQIAHSLYVDLLDKVPGEEETRSVLEALRVADGGLSSVVQVVLETASTGPVKGETAREWCRETYFRFLLRYPTPEEEAGATAAVEGDVTGWRLVLRDLASREEYRRY